MAAADRRLRGPADALRRGRGTTLVLSFWESREVAEHHRVAREAFRDRITSAVNVEVLDVSGYEVTFADLGSCAGSAAERRRWLPGVPRREAQPTSATTWASAMVRYDAR